MPRKFGWRPSLPDFRDGDYAFRKVVLKLAERPPVKYLICSPVVDQEDLGSCVFFALTAHMVATAVEVDAEPQNLSQLWAYYHYRKTYGQVEYDNGAYIRDAIKLVGIDGIPLENCWPYVIQNFAKVPPDECLAKAAVNRIQSYHALDNLEDMLDCIASGFGFICGITCYSSIDSDYTTRTGIVTLPERGEKVLGGHAIYVGGGYDMHKRMFKFQNSWGKEWGDDGFGWIPFEYLENKNLAGDFFTVRR